MVKWKPGDPKPIHKWVGEKFPDSCGFVNCSNNQHCDKMACCQECMKAGMDNIWKEWGMK